MITRKILKIIIVAGAMLPLLLLLSCFDERFEGGQPASGDETTVSFSLRLSGPNSPNTRALLEIDENEVRAVEVLQFGPEGGDYIRTTYATTINPGNDSWTKSFSVRLIKGEYDLMILANPRPRVKVGYAKDATRQMVMDSLYADLPTDGKWNADPSSGEAYSPIPMWGEVKNVDINDSTSLSGANAVPLIRMVAKVNVQVKGAAENQFLLKSIRVYNYNSLGSLVPAAANFGTTHNAIMPTIPSGSELRGKPADSSSPPLLYDGTTITTENKESENEIYLFESAKGSATNLSENTCLVIGGEYGGSDTETFYRVDFANKSEGVWSYLSLLRNHEYNVNITTVSGAGFPTPEDAFNSAPVNIEAEVLDWDDGGLSDIIFDGQYYVSFPGGKTVLVADQAGSDARLYFSTNALLWNGGSPTNLSMSFDNFGNQVKTDSIANGRFFVRLQKEASTTSEEKYFLQITANTGYKDTTAGDHDATLSIQIGRIRFDIKIRQVENAWSGGDDQKVDL